MKTSANWKDKIHFQVALHAIILVLAFVQGLGLGWLAYRAEPSMTVKTMPSNGIHVGDSVELWSSDYTEEEGYYNTDDRYGTPVLYMDLSKLDMEVQTISITVEGYIDSSFNNYNGNDHLRAKLLVADVDQEHGELDYIVEFPKQDEKTIVFQVPKARYGVIGLTINGRFRIDDICVSPDKPGITQSSQNFSLSYCLLPFLMLFVAYELIAWFRLQILARIRWAIQHSDRIALIVSGELLGIFLMYFIGWGVFRFALGKEYNLFRKAFFCAVGALLPALIAIWPSLAQKPERAFAAIALCTGLLFTVILPTASLVTWDDQIHYRTALALASGDSCAITAADDEIVILRTLGLDLYKSYDDTVVHNRYLDKIHAQGTQYYETESLKLINISFLPFASGIWIGRLLHLPFSWLFRLGRILTLLTYVSIMTFAIGRLRHGKILLSAVALVPLSIYQACNCTYDSWLAMFVMLGTALYFSEIQHIETPISIRREIGIIFVFILGILPKAVYFPILWMLFAMPKAKFTGAKHRRLYYAVLVIGIVVSIMHLALTVFNDTSVITDTRGGGDVNGALQIQNILHHPVQYGVFLVRYLLCEFFNPVNADSIMNYVGYFTTFNASFEGFIWVLLMLLFISLTCFDGSNDSSLSRGADIAVRIGMGGSAFATMALVATTMYIAFTPVGFSADTISGVQGRYFFPMLFAGLTTIHTKRIRHSIPLGIYNGAVFVIMVIVLYGGIWKVLIQMQ
ncbi:MAG: DUF2142 domain-containing protein [Clostridia bacterium]|nr:DUF2142 domain-containing protein [Clostridia bacterium]